MARSGMVSDNPGSDLEALYAAHAGAVRRIVTTGVRAPEAVIEDACQTAWSRLLARLGMVRREAVLSWLVITASREAVKASQSAQRLLPLEALSGAGSSYPTVSGPEELVTQRERLAEVQALPRRQQQLIWLHGLGFSYAEMAARTGDSRRTVERQLLRAKHSLKRAA